VGQHLLPEAIAHALAAHDFACAAELIERLVVLQSWHNPYHTQRRWLSHLPEEVLRLHPRLSLRPAQAMVLTTQSGPSAWQLVQEHLSDAEQGYREAGNQAGLGAVLTGRVEVSGFQGELLRVFALARQGLTLLPPEDRQWRGLGLSLLGTEAILAGQTAKAVPLLRQALALCDASGLLPASQLITLMLGEACLAAGDLQQAACFFRRALDASRGQPDLTRDLLTDDAGRKRTHFERLAWYSLAHLAYVRNDLAKAQDALQESLGEGQFVLIHVLTPGLLLQVRLLYAQGKTEQARSFLVELETSASRPEVKREIHLCQAWLALKMGDLAEVKRWAQGRAQAPLAFVRRVEETVLHARLQIAEGQPEVATRLLEPLMQEARDAGHLHTELQLLVLQALAEEARGNDVQACQHLLQAVTRGSLQGYHRLFLEEGPPMQRLLKRLLPNVREQALACYVRRLLQAFASAPVRPLASPEEDPSPRPNPLTPQEQLVLGLLAGGASNQDIADALVISLATAKKHVAKILSKLGADNRTQALARARQDGLL
jgi:LuxR family maltose regulon positive regulatory protein